MATNTEATRETFDWTGFRLSWGAILAGVLVATAVQIILSLLGIAIGFGAIEFGPGAEFGEFGIGAGIWAIATALISLFVGGLTAGHLAGILTRLDGALHGVLVWGLSLVLTLWAIGAGIGTVLGGVFGVAGQTLSAAVGGVTEVGAAVVQRDQLPPLTEPQNRQELVDMLQRETQLTPAQAEQAADAFIQGQQQFRLGAEEFERRAPEIATEAAGAVSTAAWWALLAAILSLAAAAGGAAVTSEE